MRHYALLAIATTCCFNTDRDKNIAAPYDGDGGRCEYTEIAYEMDDATPLGFSGAELAAALGGSSGETLSWDETGDTTELTFELSFAEDGQVRHQVGEWVEPDTGGFGDTGGQECAEYVIVDASLSFVTADGLMNELVAVEVEASTAETGRVEHTMDLAELTGSYVSSDSEAVETADSAEIEIVANVNSSGSVGELGLFMTGHDEAEEGDPDVAWASQGDIARWPPNE